MPINDNTRQRINFASARLALSRKYGELPDLPKEMKTNEG